MTISVKHTFQSAKPDGADATLVQPSNWNDEHVLTLATNKLLGRATAGTGAVEEIGIGTALSLSGGNLAVTTVPVANGGTGANTLTANNVLLGNGTSAVQVVAPGTSGNVLTSDGTTWVSQTPAAATTTYEKITTVNASGASTVDFTNLSSTYSQYIVISRDLLASTATSLRFRASIDNGATFDTSTNYWDQTTTSTGASITADTQLNGFLRIGSLDTNPNYLRLMFENIGVAQRIFVEGVVGRLQYFDQFLGTRALTTTVNAIRIYPATGTISGTFYLYGVRA